MTAEHGCAGGLAAILAAPAALGVALSIGAFWGSDYALSQSLHALIAAVFFGAPIALLHLGLALPLCHLLEKRWRLRWWNAALGGALVGAIPIPLIMLMSSDAPFGTVPRDVASSFLGLGFAGFAGGLAFWAVARERAA